MKHQQQQVLQYYFILNVTVIIHYIITIHVLNYFHV